MVTKSGLLEACKGFDINQVINVLKTAGWLILDNEGKSTRKADFRNNETDSKRFYCLRLPPLPPDKKAGGSVASRVIAETSTTSTASTKKTDIATQVVDRGRI